MDIGIRPMIPATENRQARGMAKISAYGARNPRGPRTPMPAPPALVIACLSAQKSKQNLKILCGGNRFSPAPRSPLFPCPLAPAAYQSAGKPWLDGSMPAYDAFLL